MSQLQVIEGSELVVVGERIAKPEDSEAGGNV